MEPDIPLGRYRVVMQEQAWDMEMCRKLLCIFLALQVISVTNSLSLICISMEPDTLLGRNRVVMHEQAWDTEMCRKTRAYS